MDFEGCFLECCQTCNFLDEDFKLPLEIQDQGDCKGDFAFQDEQCIWMNTDKEKTIRNRVREDTPGLKTENLLTKLQSSSFDCSRKSNQKQNFSDKPKCEIMQETENFSNYRNPFNFPYAKWNSNHSERTCASDDHLNYDKTLVDSVLELKEKVDILFQILKDCEQKPSTKDCEKRGPTKAAQPMFGDFWHLFDFNKRLCATEEGIKKLALILEDLLTNFKKRNYPFEINAAYRDPLNFEEMSMGQRINLLKNRNDLLLDLVKKFLKVGSVEEIYSTLSSLPKNAETKQASEFQFKEKTQEKNLNGDDLIDSLKNLRMQFTKSQEKKPQVSVSQPKIVNEGRENGMKYFGNKLEVISEQAELTLNNENECTNMDDSSKKNGRKFKEKVSKDNEESETLLSEITSKLLAKEALLKSSLDKVHFEIFSKFDLPDKKCLKENQNVTNKTEVSIRAENQQCDTGTDFNSLSFAEDISCIFGKTKSTAKSRSSDTILRPEKCTQYKEFTESVKEEENFSENISDNICKRKSSISDIKIHQHKEVKTKYPRKALHKNTFTVLGPSSKSSKNDYCLPVRCYSSRGKPKNEGEVKDNRPVTAPNSLGKSMPTTSLKLPVSQKNIKKNLGLNNVINKNKTSLSKKTSFKTS